MNKIAGEVFEKIAYFYLNYDLNHIDLNQIILLEIGFRYLKLLYRFQFGDATIFPCSI